MQRVFQFGMVNFVGKVILKYKNETEAQVTPATVDVAVRLGKKYQKVGDTKCYIVPLNQIKIAA